ncbi:hypothetical protein SAMN02745857_03864 [Andreprevotia lacus DSM 23236]|uniref:Uncharacterized protein n=1 Tax=Andreprevotia lacus DSM 23236 TaxID=1121001 RepID=A0A1W1XZY0_9NEIS|nr:hypothetical protein [Andreprevotia lacus]SMC29476.1 hypothetical protein SAMN02745857_03864 [Andreprevotia lacus DSM 23236]
MNARRFTQHAAATQRQRRLQFFHLQQQHAKQVDAPAQRGNDAGITPRPEQTGERHHPQ